MKYLWFSEAAFTGATVCQAHELAFAFFGGVPETIVYDLDRTMVVDENMGEILLTAPFKEYVASAGFKLHFCRKADPQSKGKVENVVGYVKKNFLYNRAYLDLDTLNSQYYVYTILQPVHSFPVFISVRQSYTYASYGH